MFFYNLNVTKIKTNCPTCSPKLYLPIKVSAKYEKNKKNFL